MLSLLSVPHIRKYSGQLLLVFLFLLIVVIVQNGALAQQNESAEENESSQINSQPQGSPLLENADDISGSDDALIVEGTDEVMEESAENDGEQEITADQEEQGAGRFVPTEEISQDLGVSFPADI